MGHPRFALLFLAASLVLPSFAVAGVRPALLAAADAALDTSGTWVLLSDLHAPPALNRPVGVFDPISDRLLVLEGGYATGWPAVQCLDLGTEPHWSELAVDGPPPAGRVGPSVVFDPRRERMLLFAGAGYADVWELALTPTCRWQPLVAAGETPPVRSMHAAVYDPVRDRMVVFGGMDGSTYLNDTWALSLRTNQWERLATSGAAPARRAGHRAAYDPRGDRLVVLGGQTAAGYANDVWALPLGPGGEWTELAPAGPCPSPRARFGMAADAHRSRLLVQGGITASGYAGDLWALDLADTLRWEVLSPTDSLAARADLVMCGDSLADRLIAYGGNADGTAWDRTSILPLGGDSGWLAVLPPSPPVLPGPRSGQMTVYDSRRGRVLVLGGTCRPEDRPAWSLSAADEPAWSPLPLATPFPVGAAVYDSVADQVIVFSGAATWALPLDTYTWRLLDTSGRSDLQRATYTFDPLRHRIVVCGGQDAMDPCRCVLRDVEAFRLDAPCGWEHLGNGPHPEGMAGHSAFYDPAGDRLIVLGGYWQNGTTIHHGFGPEWWASPLGGDSLTWTPLYAGNAEPGAGQTIYDPLRRRALRFADYGTLGVWQAWSRSVADSAPWLPLATCGAGPLAEAPIVFDVAHDRAVMAFTAPAGTVPAAPDQVWALFFGDLEIVWQATTAEWNGVETVWRSPLARGLFATLQRADGSGGEWSDVGEFRFDDDGILRAADASVRPATRYGYRLAMSDVAAATTSDAIWVNVPAGPGLAFAGARPNPTSAGLRVAFTLPDASPARIEVADVAGRRILSREVGDLGPGPHTVELTAARAVPAGLYLMRLTRGSESRTARVVVIR